MVVMTVKHAKTFGEVSTRNSKMPGSSFAIDAFACKVGDKLAKVKGSVCEVCYARRIQRMRPSVDMGWRANLQKFKESKADQWAQALAFQILRYSSGFHRWFDSGDLQSVEMLSAIVEVCRMTPKVKHWLPTREVKTVRDWLKANGDFPPNLCVRISSPMVGDSPLRVAGVNTSTVHKKGEKHAGDECIASKQGNQCLDCRNCWDKRVANISYPKH